MAPLLDVMDPSADALRRRPGIAPRTWALVVLLLGLSLTAYVAYREWQGLHKREHQALSRLADDSVIRLRQPFMRTASELRAMQTVFLAANLIDAEQFLRYDQNLRRSSDLPSHVATAFARRRDNGDGVHYVYELVSPLKGNEGMSNLDIASQKPNLEALWHARDTDLAVISSPFRLQQGSDSNDEQDAIGVAMRLPVYSPGPRPTKIQDRRQRELGALGISLRLRPLMERAWRGEILDTFHIRVTDATAQHALLFDSGGVIDSSNTVYRRRMDYGRQHWQIELQPRAVSQDTRQLQILTAAGGLVSLLLSLLLWSITNTRRRAVTLGTLMSERFRESESRFRTLNELLPALVLLADAEDGNIRYANQAARQRLGDVVAASLPLSSVFLDRKLREQVQEFSINGTACNNVEAVLIALQGSTFWANASVSRVEVDGREHLLMVATDITEQHQLNDMLVYQATHDALTELFNRREFEKLVEKTLAVPATLQRPWALLYFDLDQFKLINDVSGHMAGDQLLAQLAYVMRQQLRDGDVLARLGGDEFGLIAHDADLEAATAVAERLRHCVEALMFVWQGRTYTVSASIGLVMVERGGITLKDLLAWADTSCYLAKENGRNRVHVYREDDETSRRQGEMEWANKIRWAMEEDRLLLDYQEINPLQPGMDPAPHIELLLRLRDEDGRVVQPGAFLPAAERYGLMPAIDRWVIHSALANFSRLHARGAGIGLCAINLSGATVEDDELVDYILELIQRYRVPPSCLCFEITETVAVRSLLKVVQIIERLRAAGCHIALDDFGAGMSSFGYLKNLPADIIKIDGSFIRDLDSEAMSRTIVTAITQIGHQLGLEVVAEWVSNQQTLEALRGLGVDYAQGFALHQPERVLFQRDQAG